MNVFEITPVSTKPLWYLGGVCVLLSVLVLTIAYSAYAAYNSRAYIGDDYIKLSGGFFSRTILISDIEVSKMRVIDMSTDPELSPKHRSVGIRVPGYSSGWFKLKNKEKALLFVTNENRVAYIPTKQGYSILTSVDRPQQFLDEISALN